MAYNSELGSDRVKVSSSAIMRSQTRKIFRAVIWILVVLFIIYVFFAATLIRVVPAVGTGPLLTANITAEGGMIPAETMLVVDNSRELDGGVGTNLETAFIPSSNYRVMEVIAGPYGDFSVDSDLGVSFEGEQIDLTVGASQIEDRDHMHLNDEYLVRCVDGDCTEDGGYIVSRENIVGEQIEFSEVFSSNDEREVNTGEVLTDEANLDAEAGEEQ